MELKHIMNILLDKKIIAPLGLFIQFHFFNIQFSMYKPTFTNPFLSENPKELWKKLEKDAKPISKEEVIRRAQAAKNKSQNDDK